MNLKKMYNLVICGMVGLLIVTLLLLSRFNSLINHSRDLNQDGIKLITLSNDMLKTNDYLIKLMRVFVVNNDAKLLKEYNALLTYENLNGKLVKMSEIGLTESEETVLNALFTLLDKLAEIEARAIDAYNNGDHETAASIIFSEEYVDTDFLLTNMTSKLIEIITTRVNIGVMEIQNQLQEIKLVISLFISLSILCLIILQVMQRHRVLKPIVEIEEIMQGISRGDVSKRLVKGHDDEIGSLFDHVNSMADSIESYMNQSKNSLNILENILNGLDAFVYVTDPETDIVLFINKKMEEHFNISDDAVGQHCYKILQEGVDDRCDFCPCYQLDREPDKIVVWEEHNTVTKRDYRNTDCYIEWLNGIKVHLQHSVDITDLKKYMNEKLVAEREALEMMHKKEKAEEAARAKNDFLAKMSHEIRTPMNAVMGMSELILRKDLPQDVYENALLIKNSSVNLLSIINDILDFSKIESGMMEIVETSYYLPSLINDVIGIIRVRLIDKPVHFSVNIDPALPATLIGDEIRVRQTITNLLSNAVKYTNEGFISLKVEGVISGDTVTLSIEISDSGIGVKEEDIGKLFGDFVQIDTAKNKGIEGTGLGLAISRNLCRMMGGDISVVSEYGKGSSFTVTLPQRFDEYIPFACVNNPVGKSVLLYETRVEYRRSLIKTIESLGIECKSVENIPALFEDLENYPFVFISSFLYGSISPVLSSLSNQPKIALLADITETGAPRNVRVLALPAHSLSIANILNDINENYSGVAAFGSSFTAPEAKVLIVDDVAANLKVGEGLLLPYEMQVTLCGSGRDAIELVSSQQFDLVFMDHMMPEMDGLEATSHIRAMEGEYFESLPIIALTANAVSGVREMFVQNGMNDFLAKPIETAKLDAILEKWIPKHKRKSAKPPEAPEAESAFISMLRTVSELSVDKALSIVGGSFKTYERIIKLSVRLLPENIVSLENLINTSLPNYSIEVHGVKGVLNNIGAYNLASKAFELEELSRNGDFEACNVLHPAFISMLATFSDSMQDLLEEDKISVKPEGEISDLLEILPQLEEAADFGDNATALKVISSISNHTYGNKIDKMILDMTNAFECFDFDAAIELIEQLKGGL